MPGASFITALAPCCEKRNLEPSRPRTCTFDAEIVIGQDDDGNPHTVLALVYHYTPPEEPELVDNPLYLLVGKMVSITDSTAVGEGRMPAEYDFVIYADLVHFLSVEDDTHSQPVQPYVMIAGWIRSH